MVPIVVRSFNVPNLGPYIFIVRLRFLTIFLFTISLKTVFTHIRFSNASRGVTDDITGLHINEVQIGISCLTVSVFHKNRIKITKKQQPSYKRSLEINFRVFYVSSTKVKMGYFRTRRIFCCSVSTNLLSPSPRQK